MILDDFALLASDTTRTKAYIQAMIREEMLPKACIVYSDDIDKMREDAKRYVATGERHKYFNVDEPLLTSLDRAQIPYAFVCDKDVNSESMRLALLGLSAKHVIYSGYGGYILRKHLFEIGKKYIHIHAGLLPQYRGSTTAYYSFLQEGKFGATAIFLSKGIDEGEIITKDIFDVPNEAVDIDYIYEPYIRSQVLIKAIKGYLDDGGTFSSERQREGGAETYYIIHPVLKHLALMKMEQMWNCDWKEGK